MDVRSLRYAVTLAEELHFGRAAAREFIAAQAFGRHIRSLERDVGARLFARTSRRVALTPEGTRFVARARQVLARFDELAAPAHARGDDPCVLRVGVLGFGLADLWPTVRAALAASDDVHVRYVELDWCDQYDAVLAGDVDVAIVHDVGPADGLVLERAFVVPAVVATPLDSDLADADRLTVGDVTGRRWVSPFGCDGWLATWTAPGGEPADVSVRSPSGIPTAVASTGVPAVHGEPARRYFPHPAVRYIPLDGVSTSVSVAARDGDRRGPIEAFRAVVRAVADTRPGNPAPIATDPAHDPTGGPGAS